MESSFLPPALPAASTLGEQLDRLAYRAQQWSLRTPLAGLLVIEDSARLAESGELAFFLGRFATELHEPFSRDYLEDDLAGVRAETGFRVEAVESHNVAKVFVARKPLEGSCS